MQEKGEIYLFRSRDNHQAIVRNSLSLTASFFLKERERERGKEKEKKVVEINDEQRGREVFWGITNSEPGFKNLV